MKRWAIVFAAVFAVYWPALGGELLWNDSDYVTAPRLTSLGGLWRIWTEVGATEQYYPLLHSFFWLQNALWGNNPLGHHIVNVGLHATAACLLGTLVHRLTADMPAAAQHAPPAQFRPRVAAWLASALFALHPVMVESVAWISEQKNTLSTVLFFAAALAFLRWDRSRIHMSRPDPFIKGSGRDMSHFSRSPAYLAASGLFICALLSKSVTASLPAALLVVLWWKRGRLERGDVVPLLPWFVAGAAIGLFTAWVEHAYVGAKGSDLELGFLERGLLAGRIIWFYLGKLAWPAELIFIYPRWDVDTASVLQWVYPIAAIGLLIGLWSIRHRGRGPLAAYLYFTGTLFPTLGFFNVYAFKFSFVADHWQYLSAAGIIAAVAIVLAGFLQPRLSSRAALFAIAAPVGLVLAVFAVQSFRQAGGYRDLRTFYERTLSRNPRAWMAHNNLGLLEAKENRTAEAIAGFETALRLKPDFPEAENNLGVVLLALSRRDEAIRHFEKAIALNPSYAEARFNLGMTLNNLGRPLEAVAQLEAAARIHPDVAEIRAELRDAHAAAGSAFAGAGRIAEAVPHFAESVRLDPTDPGARFNLGLALARTGRVREAVPAFREAVRLAPGEASYRMALAQSLAETGASEEAARQAAEAQRLREAASKR